MTAEQILASVTRALASANIPYMVTGSFASSLHGRPRATQDVDLVIAPDREQLLRFVRGLSSRQFYVSEEAALRALEHEDQFNVIEPGTGWKVDLIMKKSRPFSSTEFDRRAPADLQGTEIVVASAEDVLLSKLEWAKKGGSQRQIEDAAGILQIRGRGLDLEYIGRWVGELGLHDQWRAASAAAGW